MGWQRRYSLCRPNNSRLDDIAQGALTLTVQLLNDGQGPVAGIAREVGIPCNRSYKWQKEVALHGGVFPGSGGQAEPAAELEPLGCEARDARKGRGEIPPWYIGRRYGNMRSASAAVGVANNEGTWNRVGPRRSSPSCIPRQ